MEGHKGGLGENGGGLRFFTFFFFFGEGGNYSVGFYLFSCLFFGAEKRVDGLGFPFFLGFYRVLNGLSFFVFSWEKMCLGFMLVFCFFLGEKNSVWRKPWRV